MRVPLNVNFVGSEFHTGIILEISGGVWVFNDFDLEVLVSSFSAVGFFFFGFVLALLTMN